MAGTDLAIQTRYGLDIVVEDFDSGVDNDIQRGQVAFEVRY
jgi:hypothetical protein